MWLEWNGGECPVPDGTLVDVGYRDGETACGVPANVGSGDACLGFADAGPDYWHNDGASNDIVRYRVCAEQPAPVIVAEEIDIDYAAPDHPLATIFAAALEQVTKGKGAERHANGAEFMEQPWLALANTHGNGFLTGQAAKKLMEAQGMAEHDRWEREMLGAIVYAAMAIVHRRVK